MLKAKFVIGVTVIALMAPALALASNGKGPTEPGGPKYETTPPPQAKAYGKYCQGESKRHVDGEKGTAFSRCVAAMAHAAEHQSQSPREACKGKSKKHVKGEKGTEYSRCVTSVAKLRHDERRKEREEQEQQGTQS